jgi:hypothetical protein
MHRREVLRTLAATAALPFVPGTADGAIALGRSIHCRLALNQTFGTLSAAQQRVVAALSDGILPRTDTPGAVDVGVPQFIDLMLTEWYDQADRDAFLAGLAAIDELARADGGGPLADLAPATRQRVLAALDASRNQPGEPGATFRTLKSLTVYGYFTSEAVSREVLPAQIFFEAFDGCAPVGG